MAKPVLSWLTVGVPKLRPTKASTPTGRRGFVVFEPGEPMTHKQILRFIGKFCQVTEVRDGQVCRFVGMVSEGVGGSILVGEQGGTGFVLNLKNITDFRFAAQTIADTAGIRVSA